MRGELEQHDMQIAGRPEIAVMSKAELPDSSEQRERVEREIGKPLIAISAVTGQGLDEMRRAISAALDARDAELQNARATVETPTYQQADAEPTS